jgi:hypothetical protein
MVRPRDLPSLLNRRRYDVVLTKEEAKKLSLAELERVGRFNLRNLGQELGMFPTRQVLAAFHSMSNADQAANVHMMLRLEDHPLLAEMRAAVEDQAREFHQMAEAVHAAHVYYRKAPTKLRKKRSRK